MADNKSGKRSSTQQMGVPVDDEAPAQSTTGKRSFNAGGARGLAAFDKDKGPPKKPAGPTHDHDDEDLRAARMEASAESADDDGMVETSKSFWGDAAAAAPVKGKKGRAAAKAAAEEEEGEEAPVRKRSSAWKWILGLLLLGGAGVGAWFGITEAQRSSGGAATSTSDAKPTKHEADAEAASDEEPAEETSEPKNADAADAAAASDAGQAGKEVAGAAKETPQEMNVSEPVAWAPAVEASNPWVALAPAPAGHLLGLSASEAADGLASSRTGFRPEAQLAAPQKAYRIESHEVTWGEIAKAETIPDAATFARPKWLPADAARQAKLPATGVPWAVAQAFCRGLGGDLPSEAEWEWAARGPDNRYLPWGRDAFGTNEVHTVAEGAVPVVAVKTSKLDRTPGEPIFDLLGNAQEWTRDPWRPADGAAAAVPTKNATHRAIRGWPLADPGASIPAEGTTYRAAGCADPACMAAEGAALERVGFRCVKNGG